MNVLLSFSEEESKLRSRTALITSEYLLNGGEKLDSRILAYDPVV
jgi:hypothetical protein